MTVVMKRRGEGIKLKKKVMLSRTVAYNLQTNAQPVPKQQLAPPSQLLHTIWDGMGCPFGQFRSQLCSFLASCAAAPWQSMGN